MYFTGRAYTVYSRLWQGVERGCHPVPADLGRISTIPHPGLHDSMS
uniref:Uncharacterized protein n=1 Tax=Anguilla anguilla TaxID=7936 RepID=A0A0E9WUK3_ANGAN